MSARVSFKCLVCDDSMHEWFLETVDFALSHRKVPAELKRKAEEGLRELLVHQDRLIIRDSGVPGEPPLKAIEMAEERTDAMFRILKNCGAIDAAALLDDYRDRTGISCVERTMCDTGVPDLCRA